jgi:hypothetical protein
MRQLYVCGVWAKKVEKKREHMGKIKTGEKERGKKRDIQKNQIKGKQNYTFGPTTYMYYKNIP